MVFENKVFDSLNWFAHIKLFSTKLEKIVNFSIDFNLKSLADVTLKL